jgi:hypothetical protein
MVCGIECQDNTRNPLGQHFANLFRRWMFGDDEKVNKGRAGFLVRVPKVRLYEKSKHAGPLQCLNSKGTDFHTDLVHYFDGSYAAG